MTVSDGFLEYVQELLQPWSELASRKMFGGAGLYSEGILFAFIMDDVVYLKVDETTKNKYRLAGAKAFKPFSNRPTVASYYQVPDEVLLNSKIFIEWSKEAVGISKRQVRSYTIKCAKVINKKGKPSVNSELGK